MWEVEKMSKRIKAEIIGMHCASCASNVERAVKKIKGTKSVSVSVMTNKAIIEADDNVNPEEIKKRSNELLWIVIGIAVILGARILVSVIINTLEATGTVNSAIIQNDRSAINSQ